MPDGSLAGRDIVVAGASGGLGSATVALLEAEGARVTAGYRTRATGGARGVQADLTVAEDRRKLLDAAPALYGLVVLAGDPARVKEGGELEAAMERSFQVNCEGPVLLAREAAGRMLDARTPGAIILFATMQAVGVFPGSTAYAGAKAALIHDARILAKENRGANIRVNVVSPGVIEAGMALASIGTGKHQRLIDEATIPRYGRAADVARAVRFLLEPDNYITGQVLQVDGGATL